MTREEICTWTQNNYESDSWTSDCGLNWNFPEDTPKGNGMVYCTKCGKLLEEKLLPKEDY